MILLLRQRLFEVLPTLLGVTLLSFFLFHIAGGDPTLRLVGKHGSPEQIQNLKQQLGTDKSLAFQYLDHTRDFLSLNLGTSWSTKEPVIDVIQRSLGPTLALSLPGFLLSLFLSLSLGCLASFYRGKLVDRTIIFTSFNCLSSSFLFFILLFQYVFAFHLRWFPVAGWADNIRDQLAFIALPTLIYGVGTFGPNTIFFRSLFIEELKQQYPKTAIAKGAGKLRLFRFHILRNALTGILPLLAAQIPTLFLGSVLLETFFGIPGLGRLLVDSFNDADFPMIKGLTLMGSLIYIFTNLAGDIISLAINPRKPRV